MDISHTHTRVCTFDLGGNLRTTESGNMDVFESLDTRQASKKYMSIYSLKRGLWEFC